MVTLERRDKHDLSFHEDQIKLAKIMMEQVRTTLEFLYYLMDHRRGFSFTMILLSADNVELESLVQESKRETDILLEIDKENNLYMLLCQSTDLEGGEQFGEILMSNVRMHGGSTSYCVETEVKTTSYTIQEVIFTMVEKYIDIKRYKEFDKVFFTKLGEIEYTKNLDIT
jgi:hypothetical protein